MNDMVNAEMDIPWDLSGLCDPSHSYWYTVIWKSLVSTKILKNQPHFCLLPWVSTNHRLFLRLASVSRTQSKNLTVEITSLVSHLTDSRTVKVSVGERKDPFECYIWNTTMVLTVTMSSLQRFSILWSSVTADWGEEKTFGLPIHHTHCFWSNPGLVCDSLRKYEKEICVITVSSFCLCLLHILWQKLPEGKCPSIGHVQTY